MDKMIADVKSGVGKLNKAIELDPSNITEGFEKVADDANTAFARIGQAAQVSFEQLGGVILPIVTDIANAIADSWQGMNVAGSEIWKAGAGVVENLQKGSIGDFALNGTWYNVALSGPLGLAIRETTAEEIAAGAKEGSASASEVVADNLTSDLSEKMAEEFSAAQDAYIKSHPGGMSLGTGEYVYDSKTGEQKWQSWGEKRIIGGADDFEKTYEESWSKVLTTFPETYTMQKMIKTTGQSSGYLSLLDESGEELRRIAFGAKGGRSDSAEAEREMEDIIKPIFLNVPKYLKSVSSEMRDVLEDATLDGVIAPLTEKPLLEGYLETLGGLKKEYPIEFSTSGLDKIVSDIQATLDGREFSIDVKPEVDEFIANFALWKKSNAAVYEQIYAATGQIPTGPEQEERYKYEQKLAEEGSERSEAILRWLEEFDSALESNDVSSLVPIYETLLNYDPSLANEKWFTQLGDAGTSIAQKMMTAGDAAETLGGKFLDVTAALEAAAGRMLTLASEARASTAMTGWKQTVSQVNSSSRSLNAPASLTAAKTDTGYKISQFPGKLNLPKLAEGGKVTQGGLAWIGEAGPEIVIPEDDLKGLYPQSANVDKGSMRWFEDYPYRINSPASYQWSKYPAEPNVVVTGDEPRAWLSEGQPTGMDYIKSELNEVIAKSIGNSMVKPWFAGGYEAQPDWWTEAATAKSPKYADTWAEPKGGEVPDIPDQTTVKLDATQRALTVKDVWDSVYGESFTEGCIAANSPDESLMFTPSNKAVSEAASGWGKEAVVAWNYLYGESFTEGCIATNKTDKLLKFSPSSRLLAEMARTQGMSTVIGTSGGMAAATPGGWLSGKTTTSTGTDLSDALVVPGGNTASDALTRRTSWNAIYDNKGTCIAFVEPDPSMNFTPGKDYL
ncbi:MAG: hypothetical protein PHD64_11880, partial [Mesotoga sp.]|nr:hypothetical protein [Mesotoga sp.]